MAVDSYVPGACNIGKAEIARRLQFGWSGIAVTAVLAVIFYATGVPAPWRLVLFLPAAAGAVGLLQGYLHFCANFGMRGVFNFGSQVGRTDTVEQAEFRRKDRQMATRIMVWSLVIGVVVAVGTTLIG